MKKEKVLLAFSGGLDTSFCAIYLPKEKNMEVHSAIVNTGGFSDEELKEVEATVLGAEEKLGDIEYEIFVHLREKTAARCEDIQRAAETIAIIDVLGHEGPMKISEIYSKMLIKVAIKQ